MAKKLDNRFQPGDTYHIDAYSDELWLKDYHVRVCSNVTILEHPFTTSKKVLVRISEIDGDHNVTAFINKRFLYDKIT